MKLSGGIFNGRALAYPREDNRVRPTKEKVRQAIFNALQPYGITSFLDLYSGTGAMGFEAVSRQIPTVHFVDQNVSWILKNVSQFSNAKTDMQVFKRRLPEGLAAWPFSYECIFLDPPWTRPKLYEATLKAIFDFAILKPSGMIICEIPHDFELNYPNQLVTKKTARYGNTKVVYLTYES